MKTQRRDGILGFHPYFDIRHNQDYRTFSCTLHLYFTLEEIPLEATARGQVIESR